MSLQHIECPPHTLICRALQDARSLYWLLRDLWPIHQQCGYHLKIFCDSAFLLLRRKFVRQFLLHFLPIPLPLIQTFFSCFHGWKETFEISGYSDIRISYHELISFSTSASFSIFYRSCPICITCGLNDLIRFSGFLLLLFWQAL